MKLKGLTVTQPVCDWRPFLDAESRFEFLSKPVLEQNEPYVKGFGFAKERNRHRLSWRPEDLVYFSCRGAISLRRRLPDDSPVTYVVRRLYVDNLSHARFEIGIFTEPTHHQPKSKRLLDQYAREFWNSPVKVTRNRTSETATVGDALPMLTEKFLQMSSPRGRVRFDLCQRLQPQLQVVAEVSKSEGRKDAQPIDDQGSLSVLLTSLDLKGPQRPVQTVYLTYLPEFMKMPPGQEFLWLRRVRALIAWTHADLEILTHTLERCTSDNTPSAPVTGCLLASVKKLERRPDSKDPDYPMFSRVIGLLKGPYANRINLLLDHLGRSSLSQEDRDRVFTSVKEFLSIGDERREVDASVKMRKSVSGPLNDRGPASYKKRDQIFICYCHKDDKVYKEFLKMVRPIARKHSLKIWSDDEITVGAIWQSEIEKALARTKIGVLLVSPDFLDSEFIRKNELPPLLEAAQKEGVRIYWIACRPSNVEYTEIHKFHCANQPSTPLSTLKKASRDKELQQISEELFQLSKEILS